MGCKRFKTLKARWLITLAMMLFASTAPADQITVFAASSLKNALDEVSAAFDAQSGHQTTLSYAGSSALARQIQMGAPADVFISANPDWVDLLQDQGAVDGASRIALLGNRLVLIASEDVPRFDLTARSDLAGLLNGGHMAMALVQAVPAGIYGKEALQSLGLWDQVATQIAQVDNVRAALALVALGETPLGIVYQTDAQADPRVYTLAQFPQDSHRPIQYPAIATQNTPMAQAYLTFLQGGAAQSIFERHGFSVLQD